MSNILSKIKKAKLQGRGGGCFPTSLKWQLVKDAKGDRKFVVCNASEGEPGIKKDYYLLKHHPELVISGMRIAIEFLSADQAYLYINPDYSKELKPRLKKIIANAPIEIFTKKHSAGYIGGEETSALNHIEGRKIEPRLRPPFPPQKGLWNFPTLVNNVETFYDIALIEAGKYNNTRFYTVGGDCLFEGVYEFAEDMNIADVLKRTDNLPDYDFFVQVGGDGSGTVLNSGQLEQPAGGGGSITVYSPIKRKPIELMRYWADFFHNESCGQCTPCREGTKRLADELHKKEPDWELVSDIIFTLQETSFCGLGCATAIPFTTFVDNVLSIWPNNKITLNLDERKHICECFK